MWIKRLPAVSIRLKTMGMTQEQGNWLPHELKLRDVEWPFFTWKLLLGREEWKRFLHRIVTVDEKYIHNETPKLKKYRARRSRPCPSTSTSKPKPKEISHSNMNCECREFNFVQNIHTFSKVPDSPRPKQDIHGPKVMLCIWWDQAVVIYFELLNPGETITWDR